MIAQLFAWLMVASDASAETAPAAAPTGSGTEWLGPLVPIIIIFAVLYLFMIAPQRKKEKQRRAMLDAVQKNDEVVTIGGIRGKVWQVKDDDVVLKVDENVKLTFSRGAIARVVRGGEGEAKP